MPRAHRNGLQRHPLHDYRSQCIYHIVLNKAPGIPDFSTVTGTPGSHEFPPHIELLPAGEAIAEALKTLRSDYPFISMPRRCIMPDHLHLALFVKEATDTHLGIIIHALKHHCRLATGSTDSLFEEGYHDTILTGRNQLDRMLAYISDNPRRHLLRKLSPGNFHRFFITNGNDRYEAYGNPDLLGEPQIVPVRISSKFSPEELHRRKRLWHFTVLNDGVLASPFISPSERAVRDWAVDNGGAIIMLTHEPLPGRYKPSGALFDACAEGRLLVVSVPAERLSRAACLMMNDIAEHIAAGQFVPC